MKSRKLTVPKAIPFILIIGGVIGWLCSFIILWDKIQIIKNPHYIPSCNLNPIIACGSVMQSTQGSAFGFPNPIIGLGAFAVLVTIGVAILAGAKFKRWFWLGLWAGTVFGIGFVHWLFFESVYHIHALCPWCMVVWVVVITTFWYTSMYVIDQKYLVLPKGRAQKAYAWIRRHHIDLLLTWFIIITFLILKHFWYYYSQHL